MDDGSCCTRMNAGFAEAQASTKMGMVCATTWIHVWGNSTNAVCATAQASWTECAIVTEMSRTPTRRVCDDVDPCVGELDTCGSNGPGAVYECGCAPFEGDCDCDGNQLMQLANVEDARLTPTATGCATWTKWVCWAPWRATSTLWPRTATLICACTHSPHAKPVLAPRTAAVLANDDDLDGVCNADEVKGAKTRLRNTPWPRTRFLRIRLGCDVCSGGTLGTGFVIDLDEDDDGICNNEDTCLGSSTSAACAQVQGGVRLWLQPDSTRRLRLRRQPA